jgi:uncharacterized RDD family membrane protein YckC
MDDGILIGEGVVLDARPASFITRALAGILDGFIAIAALIILNIVYNTVLASGADPAWSVPLAIVLNALLAIGLPVTVETLSRGRSTGKLAAGLRIVRDDGGPVRFRHALIRALVGILELWGTAGGVALITSMVNPKGKRLGDVAAGTYAIRVRGSKGWSAPLVMPPYLAGWAQTADMRRLPDGLALAARQMLDRAAKLAPASRIALGDELAARIEPYVAPSPPPGTHPEAFLHAVLHERRDRELARGLRERARAAEQAQALHRLPFAMTDTPFQ